MWWNPYSAAGTVTVKYYPEGNGKKKKSDRCTARFILSNSIHSNRVLCSLTCAQHVNTQHTWIWLPKHWYWRQCARVNRALWAPWWKENGGRWQIPAELNFWNVEVLFDLTTNSSSCTVQLLKNVFKSKSTSTFSLGSGGVALVKSWRMRGHPSQDGLRVLFLRTRPCIF